MDASLFCQAVANADRTVDKLGTLDKALALWTGPVLEEFQSEESARGESARLTEIHAASVDSYIDQLISAHHVRRGAPSLRLREYGSDRSGRRWSPPIGASTTESPSRCTTATPMATRWSSRSTASPTMTTRTLSCTAPSRSTRSVSSTTQKSGSPKCDPVRRSSVCSLVSVICRSRPFDLRLGRVRRARRVRAVDEVPAGLAPRSRAWATEPSTLSLSPPDQLAHSADRAGRARQPRRRSQFGPEVNDRARPTGRG